MVGWARVLGMERRMVRMGSRVDERIILIGDLDENWGLGIESLEDLLLLCWIALLLVHFASFISCCRCCSGEGLEAILL